MRKTSAPGRRRHDAGQALVEMALISPILLLMILGLIDFARAWNIYQVITDAAREATRTLVVDSGDWSDKRDAACNAINAALERASIDPGGARLYVGNDLTPCSEPPGIACSTGNPCTVAIEYDYVFALIGPFWRLADPDGTITLSTQSVMRTE